MDSLALSQLQPVLIILAAGMVPVSIAFVIGFFRHKNKELELERELRQSQLANEKLALEVRLRALEAGMLQLAAPPDKAAEPQPPQLLGRREQG